MLLPRREDIGTITDINPWHSLLRSLAGYHAYRRLFPSGMSIQSVIRFLLFNPQFPRSLGICAGRIIGTLGSLHSDYRLHGGARAIENAERLSDKLHGKASEDIIASGLHEFLDGVQIDLDHVTNEIAAGYFGYGKAGSQTGCR